ncbi:MAG: Fe-only nitrogenase accessory AnfO family protein [Methanoregulaceae archaeon]
MCGTRRFQEIAVLLGESGSTVTLGSSGNVVVFRRNVGVWEPVRSMTFSFDQTKGLRELRRQMEELLKFMESCRIFVAKSASGALYYELEKARCNVWEVDGKPADFLDQVLRDETKLKMDQSRLTPVPGPLEKSKGYYVISIKDIQGKRPDLTSKQVLLKFVQEGQFAILEITCDHVPPWIEMTAESKKFVLESEKTGRNEYLVRLRNPAMGGI